MGGHYTDGILALIALLFAIFGWSNVVVIVATALVVLHALFHLFGWCSCGCTNDTKDMKNMPKKPSKKKKK